jgi:hypothetical protein
MIVMGSQGSLIAIRRKKSGPGRDGNQFSPDFRQRAMHAHLTQQDGAAIAREISVMDVCDEALPDTPNVAPEAPPTYVVEVAKSGRAECKKCDCKIENKTIRVGVLVEGEWGLFTRWQHLDCTVFRGVEDVEALDGYLELKAEQKAEVAERVRASADEEDEDNVPVEPDELVRKSWNEAKEPSPDLLMPLLAYQKEGLGWMVHQELNDAHGGNTTLRLSCFTYLRQYDIFYTRNCTSFLIFQASWRTRWAWARPSRPSP